jgi:hypothetical protein
LQINALFKSPTLRFQPKNSSSGDIKKAQKVAEQLNALLKEVGMTGLTTFAPLS